MAEKLLRAHGRQDPERYHSFDGVAYVKPIGIGFTVIPMLEFLKGLYWDELALNYVHALQPSKVRVTMGPVSENACPGRVTVYVSEDGVIANIEQEVSVGLRGARDVFELSQQLQEAQRARGN